MGKVLTAEDFERIKTYQAWASARMPQGKVVAETVKVLGWSERTVRRAFKSSDYANFKVRVAVDHTPERFHSVAPDHQAEAARAMEQQYNEHVRAARISAVKLVAKLVVLVLSGVGLGEVLTWVF